MAELDEPALGRLDRHVIPHQTPNVPGVVRKWAAVALPRSQTTFHAYTRSWRSPALEGLARLPNVRLWYSADAETGPTPDFPPKSGRPPSRPIPMTILRAI